MIGDRKEIFKRYEEMDNWFDENEDLIEDKDVYYEKGEDIFKRKLFEVCGVVDNPKTRYCYQLAEEYGENEPNKISGYFIAISELIK